MKEPTQCTGECIGKNSTPMRIRTSPSWTRPDWIGAGAAVIGLLIALATLYLQWKQGGAG